MHAVSCYLAHNLACGWVHKLTEICGLVPKHYLELWLIQFNVYLKLLFSLPLNIFSYSQDYSN